MQNRHLPPLLRFIPLFAQICIIFALSKLEANPFFRPVNRLAYSPLFQFISQMDYLVVSWGIEEYNSLEPLIGVFAWFNPFHCFTVACFHVDYQASHGPSIHMIHEWHALCSLHYRTWKPSVVTMLPQKRCFKICILSISWRYWKNIHWVDAFYYYIFIEFKLFLEYQGITKLRFRDSCFF